jgi:hypothetical protein
MRDGDEMQRRREGGRGEERRRGGGQRISRSGSTSVGAVGEGGWAQEGVLQADLNEFEASGKKLLFLVALRGVRAA